MKTLIIIAILALCGCATAPTEPNFTGYKVVERGADYTTILAPNEKGALVKVDVYATKCLMGEGAAFRAGNSVYLCNMPGMLAHELAHVAGMRHTAWRYQEGNAMVASNTHFQLAATPGPNCAKITAPAHGSTRYKVGEYVCISYLAGHYDDWTSD